MEPSFKLRGASWVLVRWHSHDDQRRIVQAVFSAIVDGLTTEHTTKNSRAIPQDWYLPYGFLPGSRPGGNDFFLTRGAWESYGWNPPQYLAHLPEFTEPDNIGSPKPDWSVLVAHIEPAMLAILRPRALRELRRECKRRITAAYGEDSFDDELALRLRNGHTISQDAERDRLRAAYQTIKGQIETASYETLKTFSVQDEALWPPPLENPE